MKKKALLEILKRVSEEITSKVISPNGGGCAVIAAIVGQELAKHTQVQVVVQDYFTTANLARVKKYLGDVTPSNVNHWDDAVSFNHVLLKVKVGRKWRIFDSDGLIPYVPKLYCRGTLTIPEVVELAVLKNWNPRFDRRQVPKIVRIVHNAFCDTKIPA